MAKNTVADLDTTAANNTDVASNGIAGSDNVSGGDNVIRALAAMIKKWWNDRGGQVTPAGTNTITIASSNPATYGSLVSGIRLMFSPAADNTGATTLNLDSLGAKAVRKMSSGADVALTGYELLAARRAEVVYDSTANSAAGAWILMNPATPEFYNSDAGATAGPVVDLYRNSASPAANDVLAELDFNGKDSAGNKQLYASITARIDDPVSTTEDASLALSAFKAGALVDFLYLQRNAAGTATADAVGLPKGQLSFPASQNSSSDVNTLDDYKEGTFTPGISFGGSSTGITYSTQAGTLTKIGNIVFFTIFIQLTSKGAQTGAALITGISPAASATGGVAFFGSWSGMASVVSLSGQVVTSTILPLNAAATATAQLTNANFTNTSALILAGVYYP